jgi:hypothetical protein
MAYDPRSFYESMIGAGAIVFGFSATFLAFKIQREANYYRQPAVSFEHAQAKDVLIGLTHFSSAFLLLILGTICSAVFGLLLPVFALAGSAWISANHGVEVAGLVGTLILIGAYFLDELIHYRILSSRLLNDAREWGSESAVVISGVIIAVIEALAAYLVTNRPG